MSERQFDSLTFWKSLKQADFSGKVALYLGTWFGLGLLPKAPGTFGTLGALPLVLGASLLRPIAYAGCLVLFILIAVRASGICQDLLGRTDPSEVVIDEAAGFLLTFLALPVSWHSLVMGFIFFRFFDILKPYPIKRLEKLKGGMGIVLDDLLAGLYANLCLRGFLWLVQSI